MIFFLHCEFFYPCIISFVGIMLFLVTLCCNSCFLFVKNVLRHGHENKQQFIKDITFSCLSFSINLYFSHYCYVSKGSSSVLAKEVLAGERKKKNRCITMERRCYGWHLWLIWAPGASNKKRCVRVLFTRPLPFRTVVMPTSRWQPVA